MNTIVCVKSFMSRMEAEVAKSSLAASGIQAMIEADDAGGAYPFPMSSSSKGVKLFIKEGDVKRAKKILAC